NALNLIRDEYRAVSCRATPDCLRKPVRSDANAANALNTLHNDRGNLRSEALKCVFQCFDIVKRKAKDIRSFIDRCYDRWIVRRCNRERCSSVKGSSEGDDFFATIMERSELEGILVGLRA